MLRRAGDEGVVTKGLHYGYPYDRCSALTVVPWAFFAGFCCSFLACCLIGYLVVQRIHFENFIRFHRYIVPETLYYPTALQVLGLVEAQTDPSKVVVIIAGS